MCDLREAYEKRYKEALVPIAAELQMFLQQILNDVPRIDRISARAKNVDRFVEKAERHEKDERKYTDPLREIQDQVGARIVTFYKDDVARVAEAVMQHLRHVEKQMVVPDSEREFDYFGMHFILFLPNDVLSEDLRAAGSPTFFELQIKTLFQHAWSEANHDLGYKPDAPLEPEDRRKIALASAQAWGADEIFNGLFAKFSAPGAVEDGASAEAIVASICSECSVS